MTASRAFLLFLSLHDWVQLDIFLHFPVVLFSLEPSSKLFVLAMAAGNGLFFHASHDLNQMSETRFVAQENEIQHKFSSTV